MRVYSKQVRNLILWYRLGVSSPPLAEQQRIVATVEALLGLCAALAAGVVQAVAVRGRVLQAALNRQEMSGHA